MSDVTMNDLLELASQISAIDTDPPGRILADDATPEAVARLVAQNGGCIGILSSEGDIFALMTRYSQNGAANCAIFLKGHCGDPHRVDRIGRPSEVIPNPRVSIGICTQPAIIEGLFETPAFSQMGLLARFLYAVPASNIGRRDTDPPPVPESIRQDYHDHLTSLLSIPRPEEPHTLYLAPAARAELQAFLDRLEPELAPEGAVGDIAEWAGKLGGAVARVASLFHFAEWAEGKQQGWPWDTAIPAATMQAAIRLADEHLTPHARGAFAMMGGDPHIEDAKHLLRWVTARTSFTKREAFEGTKGRFKKIERLDPVLEILEEHGHIRRTYSPEKGGPGRRPSPTYLVNPYCANSLNSANIATEAPDLNSANSLNSANAVSEAENPNSANSANCAKPPSPSKISEEGPGETNSANCAKEAIEDLSLTLSSSIQENLGAGGSSQYSHNSQNTCLDCDCPLPPGRNYYCTACEDHRAIQAVI